MTLAKLGGRQPYAFAPDAAAPQPVPYSSAYLVLATDIAATGSDITAWNDESPAADTYSPVGAVPPPQLSSINGQAAPLLGADDSFLGTVATQAVFRSTGFEAFFVVQGTASDGTNNYFDCGALLTGSDGWSAVGLTSTGVVAGYNGGTLGDVQVVDAVNILDGSRHVVRAWYDAATSTLGIQVDARAAVTLVTGEPPRAIDAPALRVGRSWDLLRQYQGRLADWVYPYLSAGQRTQMYDFLEATYGVTGP